MKVIGFLNNKGGVGKTSTAVTVAHILATVHNKKVLLIDLDPQGNATNMFVETKPLELLGQLFSDIEVSSEYQFSISDLLLDSSMDINKAIQNTKYRNLDLIPAFLTLSEIEERLKADIRTPQQFRLKHHLKDVKDKYDYVVLDFSPSVNLININGLAVADRVYIPAKCDSWSAIGIGIVKNLIDTVKDYNPMLELDGIILTDWKKNKSVSKQIYSIFQEFFGDLLLPMQISTSKLVEEMSYMQQPLLELDKNVRNQVTKDYLLLTQYILDKNNMCH